MNRILKSPTRFAAAPRTGAFCPPTQTVLTIFGHCRKLATNNGRFCRRAPSIALGYSAAARKLEAKWSRYTKKECAKRLKELNKKEGELFKAGKESVASVRSVHKGSLRCSGEDRAIFQHCKEEQLEDQEKVKRFMLRNFNIRDKALEERTEVMKLMGGFNLSGTLQRIVYHAKLEKKVPATADIQAGLDMVAQWPEFTAVLNEEVLARKLEAKDVMACVGHLYATAHNPTDGNDDTFTNVIILRAAEFKANERAALVTFLKVQSGWACPHDWTEDAACKAGE